VSSTSAPEPDAAGRDALLEALEVPRNARIAVAVGMVTAVLVALFFLGVLAGGEPGDPALYYLGLAMVVFVSTTLLAASVLTVRRALALTAHPASLVRKAAIGGLLGGIAWLGAAGAALVIATAASGGASTARTVAGFLLPWAPLLSLSGAWAVHTRYKRATSIRPLSAAGALLAVPGALVVADLGALELTVLLARPGPPGTSVPGLFLVGVSLLASGHALQGAAALSATRSAVPTLLTVAPLAGLASLALLGPGPAGIAAVAAALGLTWLGACWTLRGVADDEVPTGPDPFAS
jgi:hypothetical protein